MKTRVVFVYADLLPLNACEETAFSNRDQEQKLLVLTAARRLTEEDNFESDKFVELLSVDTFQECSLKIENYCPRNVISSPQLRGQTMQNSKKSWILPIIKCFYTMLGKCLPFYNKCNVIVVLYMCTIFGQIIALQCMSFELWCCSTRS